MKRVSLWMIGIGLCITMGLITVEPGYAEKKEHEPTCTLATLQGRYLSAFSGFLLPQAPGETQTQLAGAQVDIFHGDGTGIHHATVSLNGDIARFSDVLLSYTVDQESCAGTITLHLPFGTINSDMYLAPNGEEFVVIQTDTGSVLAGASRRVSRK
jgi:hypothetical protein